MVVAEADLPVDRCRGRRGGSSVEVGRGSTRRDRRLRKDALDVEHRRLEPSESGLQIRLPGAQIGEMCRLYIQFLHHLGLRSIDVVLDGEDRLLRLEGLLLHLVEVLLQRGIHGGEEASAIGSVTAGFQSGG